MSDEELAGAAGAPLGSPSPARRPNALEAGRSPGRVEPDAVAVAPGAPDARALRRAARRADERLDENAREILRELKAVGGDLRALRLALTGAERGPELWTVVLALSRAMRRSRAADARRSSGPIAATIAMRLYDTLTRELVELRHRPGRSGCTSAARRSTSAPHRERAAVRRLLVARSWLAAPGLRRDARPQHHRRQRQDLRGRAGPRAPSRARGDRLVPRGHGDFGLGLPDAEPLATETIPEIVALIEELIARRSRVRGRRRRVLPRRVVLPVRGALGQRPDQVEEQEPNPRKEDPATSLSGRRTSRTRTPGGTRPVGAGPAGLAHRVLGDGGEGARARSSGSTAAGWTSSSPTTRTSARSRGVGPPFARVWMHNGMLRYRREDVEVARQRRDDPRRARRSGARGRARSSS